MIIEFDEIELSVKAEKLKNIYDWFTKPRWISMMIY